MLKTAGEAMSKNNLRRVNLNRKQSVRRGRDYMSQHNRNILSENHTILPRLTAGSIVRFNYTGKEVHNPRPIVLVLNPDWRRKLHGFALEVLDEMTTARLYQIVRESLTDKIEKRLKLRLPRFKVSIKDPERFYYDVIKPWMLKEGIMIDGTPYRTYNVRGITSVRLLDYRFNDAHFK